MGGIEGLPLQLMIIILVATMGTAIIVGWMGSIETPQSIGSVDFGDNVTAEDGTTILHRHGLRSGREPPLRGHRAAGRTERQDEREDGLRDNR